MVNKQALKIRMKMKIKSSCEAMFVLKIVKIRIKLLLASPETNLYTLILCHSFELHLCHAVWLPFLLNSTECLEIHLQDTSGLRNRAS